MQSIRLLYKLGQLLVLWGRAMANTPAHLQDNMKAIARIFRVGSEFVVQRLFHVYALTVASGDSMLRVCSHLLPLLEYSRTYQSVYHASDHNCRT